MGARDQPRPVAVTTVSTGAGPGEPGAALPRGSAIHRYVVLEVLGAGAMGVVYAAYDYGLDRKVALKLVRDPGRVRAHQRLVREAKALARLSHPNVLGVFDVGTHLEQVYIAMELVDGSTLRRWLADGPRPWSEVLEVLIAAGRGLEAAHQAGVIHRDFKPENVLIEDGAAVAGSRVRVGDFGLALVGGESEGGLDSLEAPASGPALTQTGATVGTPPYMAPEQHEGRALDARADQFSFCVALYEALYEARPFAGETSAELCEAIRDGRLSEPVAGTEVPPPVWRAIVRGLSADPADRHPSMAALLAELDHRPRSRRRRVAAVLAAIIAAGAAGLLVHASLVAGDDTSRCAGAARKLESLWDAERKAAIRQRFIASEAPGATASFDRVARALDGWTGDWVALRTESCEATHVHGERSEAQLDLRMECLDDRLAELRALTDLLAGADASLVRRAGDAARGLGAVADCANDRALRAPSPPPDPVTAARARVLRREVMEVRALNLAGRRREGRQRAAELVDRSRELGYRPLEAFCLLELGRLQIRSGEHAAAEETLFAAVAAGEAGRAEVETLDAWIELVWLVGEEGGRYPEAHRLARVARGVLDRIGGHPRLEATLDDFVGVLYLDQGKLEEARAPLERALASRREIFGPEDSETAAVIQHLAILEAEEGDLEESLRLHHQARVINEAELGADHPDVIAMLSGEGSALYQLGRHAEALALFERALAWCEATGNGGGPYAAAFHNNVGLIHLDADRLEAALTSFERALAIHERGAGPDHPSTANGRQNLGLVLTRLGRPEEALAAHRRAAAIFETIGGPESPRLADALVGIGKAHLAAGRAAAAIAPLERALAITREARGVLPRDRAEAGFRLAQALTAAGGDRARGRRLAEEARDQLRGAGEASSAAEVEAWLAGKPARR
jgi:tetratricopeptide (TPR) repeat protein